MIPGAVEPLRVAVSLVGPDGILRVNRTSLSSPFHRKAVRYLEETEASSPTAIKNWLLDQAGIEPEVQACR